MGWLKDAQKRIEPLAVAWYLSHLSLSLSLQLSPSLSSTLSFSFPDSYLSLSISVNALTVYIPAYPSQGPSQNFAYSCLSEIDGHGGVGLLYETGDVECTPSSASCKIMFTPVVGG